jgi:hypothetical protein
MPVADRPRSLFQVLRNGGAGIRCCSGAGEQDASSNVAQRLASASKLALARAAIDRLNSSARPHARAKSASSFRVSHRSRDLPLAGGTTRTTISCFLVFGWNRIHLDNTFGQIVASLQIFLDRFFCSSEFFRRCATNSREPGE